MSKKIVANLIQTPDGTIIQSHHRHDYVTYTDKNGLEYMVDGGLTYLRRNIHDNFPYIELSLYEDDKFEKIRMRHSRGWRGKDGAQSLKWVPLCEMSNKWLEACIEYNIERKMVKAISTKLYGLELEYRRIKKINIKD